MTKKRLKGIHIFVVVFAMLALIVAVLRCRDKISAELENQINENLHDVASQNVQIMEQEIAEKQKLMRSMSKELQGTSLKNPEKVIKRLMPYTESYHFKRLGFIYSNGEAYTTDGFHQTLAFREFFR